MFRNYFIISLRKLKKHLALYMINVAVLTLGHICLLSAFFLFRSYGHISIKMLSAAVVVFASVSINSGGNTWSSCKEFTVRKMLGATVNNTYTLLVVEVLMLSLSAALLSLIILDLSSFDTYFLPGLYNNALNLPEIIFLFISVILMSLLIGIFPAYTFYRINISRQLRMN